jgi:hypothetical protein
MTPTWQSIEIRITASRPKCSPLTQAIAVGARPGPVWFALHFISGGNLGRAELIHREPAGGRFQ